MLAATALLDEGDCRNRVGEKVRVLLVGEHEVLLIVHETVADGQRGEVLASVEVDT